MTVQELHDDVLKPQFDHMNEIMKKLEESNKDEHQYLYSKMDEVHNRMFKSNGKQSVTDNLSELNAKHADIESKFIAYESRSRRSTDTPKTKADIAKTVGIGGAKYTGIAALIMAMIKLLEHFGV